MANQEIYAETLVDLINKSGEMKDVEFRMRLEKIIKEAEIEIGHLLTPFLTSQSIAPETRMNIIRVAGYLQHNTYLIPLRKVITHEANIRVKQEAIIAVSKFNDRRALNILNTALQSLNNPLLARTINTEISRIKQNNPVLALMPRFMEGSKSPKTFNVTLDVLKRILTPTDTAIFTKHLDAPDPMIANGAFEILCSAGDVFHDSFILDFYNKRFLLSECLEESECDDIYWLIFQFRQFLTRYQFLIEEQIPTLEEHFLKVRDIRAQTNYISIFCRSQKNDAISFMEKIFEKEPKLRKYIVEEYSGNEAAVDFLFDKLDQENSLRETIIKSLLNTQKGLNHFMENFFSMEFETQEIVTQQLPYSGEHDLVEFIRQIFHADIFRLKEILLSKVKENYEFSVKDILFDPKNEREFTFMGNEYFDTITRLFPVTSVKYIFGKIVSSGLSVSQTKKYLSKITEVVPNELVFTIREKEFIDKLFNQIVLSNNTELNVLFLGILKYIKTLDLETYQTLVHSLNIFITKREKNITPKEKGEFQRIKNSLKDVSFELKKIEEGKEEIKHAFMEETPNFELLDKVLTQYQLAVALDIQTFSETIVNHFDAAGMQDLEGWTKLFVKFPGIARLLTKTIREKTGSSGSTSLNDLRKLAESLSDSPLRIIINFQEKKLTAILREQLRETVPHVPFVTNETDPKEEDVLLCDADSLNDLILQSKTIPKKIFIFLEKAANFAAFRSYNPRTFVQPFSFFRITREIVQNLYS
ncbi:MAG: HEAT repeat domain-containing protein [bacterium]|nr:HEAT repeat domain-containing protein [bacterium]